MLRLLNACYCAGLCFCDYELWQLNVIKLAKRRILEAFTAVNYDLKKRSIHECFEAMCRSSYWLFSLLKLTVVMSIFHDCYNYIIFTIVFYGCSEYQNYYNKRLMLCSFRNILRVPTKSLKIGTGTPSYPWMFLRKPSSLFTLFC